MNLNTRRQQFTKACELFVNKSQENPDIIGIIVAGSYVYAEIGPNSDIDVFLILHPQCTYRERGNTWINGVEIEYFMNPPSQIRAYFKQETGSPHTAHMLNFGILKYNVHEEVDNLIAEAKAIMETPRPAMGTIAMEFGKYRLDDLYKDFEDCLDNQDQMGMRLIAMQFTNTCIDIFCQQHLIWRAKHKRLYAQLKRIDPEYAGIVKEILVNEEINPLPLLELKRRTEKLVGGARPEEWKLKSDLNLD